MFGLFFCVGLLATSIDDPRAKLDAEEPPIPFQRYTTQDAHGRTITFYLSRTPKEAMGKLPIVLYIQGSGWQSLFQKRGERIGGGYQNILLQVAKGRARVMAVEKPGVKFLDAPPNPGSADGGSEEFLKEHTLTRWGEANVAALRAAWTLPDIDRTRSLVVGHSEGGIVAARIAAELVDVTHVASLAGGGVTQLFDLAERAGQLQPNDKPGDAARRRQEVYEEWAKIRRDPDSTSRFWMGHPYRRWSSFLTHSVMSELSRTKARVFLAHGSLDTSSSVVAFDALVAELLARGRDVTFERVEGADHGFRLATDPQGYPAGMEKILAQALDWFLAAEPQGLGASPKSRR
jgi:dipeptidyl aminopeptidase/acylaminoacyl peptidase